MEGEAWQKRNELCSGMIFVYTHFYKHMEFLVKAFKCLKICLKNTTKAFLYLKYVLFPVLTLPNLAVKAFDVLIFSPKTYVLIFCMKFLRIHLIIYF